jgi:hypothetical protein
MKFRSWLLAKWPDTPDFASYAEVKAHWKANGYRRPYSLGYLCSCIFCMSAYVSLVVCAIGGVDFSRQGFLTWLAVWGAAVALLVKTA